MDTVSGRVQLARRKVEERGGEEPFERKLFGSMQEQRENQTAGGCREEHDAAERQLYNGRV